MKGSVGEGGGLHTTSIETELINYLFIILITRCGWL